MKWPTYRLDQCTEIVSGSTPKTDVEKYWDGDINWATPKDLSNLNQKIISDTPDKITQEGYHSCSTQLLPVGSVLFSSRAPIGHVAINGVPMCTNQGFKSFIPKKELLDASYLYYWLIFKRDYLQSLGNGATFKEVSKATIARVEIPLPPLEEQRRIAAILDKAEALRAKRREAIAKLDQLLQSVFLEMFGDPVRNEKNWQRVALGDLLISIDSGKSPVCLDRKAKEHEWGVLKLGAVTKCRYIASENKALPEDETPNSRYEVQKGDLLFSRKNTRELVAACAIVRETPEKLLLPDLIFRLVIKKENRISPIYLHSLLTYPTKRKEVQSLAGGAAGSMPNISKAKLSELLVELPNIEFQKKYESIANSIEKLREKNLDSLLEIEKLLQSIQSKFFSL